jgi:hypothetical protein
MIQQPIMRPMMRPMMRPIIQQKSKKIFYLIGVVLLLLLFGGGVFLFNSYKNNTTTSPQTTTKPEKGCTYKWEYDETYYPNNNGIDEKGNKRLVAKITKMGTGGQNNCPVKDNVSTLLYSSDNTGRTNTSKTFYSENPYIEPLKEDPTQKVDCEYRLSFQSKDAYWCGNYYTHPNCQPNSKGCRTARKFTIFKQPKNGGNQCLPMEDGKYYCELNPECGQPKCPSGAAGSSVPVTGVLPTKKDIEPQWTNILANLVAVGPNKNGVETYIGRIRIGSEIIPGKILDKEFDSCYVIVGNDFVKFKDNIEYLIYDREYKWEKIYKNDEISYPVIGGKTDYGLLYICRAKYNDKFYLGTYTVDGIPTNFKIMTDDGIKTDIPENDVEYLLY